MRIDLVLLLSCLVSCSGSVVRSNPEGAPDSGGEGAGASTSTNPGGQTMSAGGRPSAGGAFTAGGTPATGGAAGGSGGSPDPQRCDGVPNPTPLRALSSWEYERSVLALTQHAVTEDLPEDPLTDGTFAWSMDLSIPVFRLLFDEAETQGAVARNLAVVPCDPVLDGEAACAEAFVDQLVSRAFRRPLSDAEQERYLELFELGNTAVDFATGVELVVEAALLSPMFLHKHYWGSGGNGPTTPLTAFEVASRLSYLFSGAPPGEALSSAAAKGELLTEESVESAARRLMTETAFDDSVQHFHVQWLGLDSLRLARGPGLTPQLLTSMRTETEHFIDYVFHDGERSFPALLQAPVGFVDSNLAPRYGVMDPGIPFGKVALDPNRYFGLLTQASTLTRFPNPTYRGKFVREQLLCMKLPAPPADVDRTVQIQPGETRRQAWMRHQTSPACAGCHQLMDPIGFGFENFDEAGLFRSFDNGLPVDASGELTSVEEIQGAFIGAGELASKLSRSRVVGECLVRHWSDYALQRPAIDGDACDRLQIYDAFAAADLDMGELLVALSRSHRFRTRDAYELPDIPQPAGPRGPAKTVAERRKLLLDFNMRELAWLLQVVPPEDRLRLEQQMEAVRSLEVELVQFP